MPIGEIDFGSVRTKSCRLPNIVIRSDLPRSWTEHSTVEFCSGDRKENLPTSRGTASGLVGKRRIG